MRAFWVDWIRHFTVTDSDLVVNAAQLASIVGSIYYEVPAGAMSGNITAHAVDTANGQVDYDGSLYLVWELTEGGEVGVVVARSASSVASGPVYDVASEFRYGNNEYFLKTVESTSHFLVSAVGGYGGKPIKW